MKPGHASIAHNILNHLSLIHHETCRSHLCWQCHLLVRCDYCTEQLTMLEPDSLLSALSAAGLLPWELLFNKEAKEVIAGRVILLEIGGNLTLITIKSVVFLIPTKKKKIVVKHLSLKWWQSSTYCSRFHHSNLSVGWIFSWKPEVNKSNICFTTFFTTWFKWCDCHQLLGFCRGSMINSFIWIRCARAGRHLKPAGYGELGTRTGESCLKEPTAW